MAVVSQTEKNKVNVPSKAPTGAVDGAVKGVLSGKFLEGLTTMINGALNTVLGSSFGGEMEKKRLPCSVCQQQSRASRLPHLQVRVLLQRH